MKLVLFSDLFAERKWTINRASVGGAVGGDGAVGDGERDGADELSESESGGSEFILHYPMLRSV